MNDDNMPKPKRKWLGAYLGLCLASIGALSACDRVTTPPPPTPTAAPAPAPTPPASAPSQ